jgi:hypothetical protein
VGLVGGLRVRWTGGGTADVHGEGQRTRSLRATLTLPEGAHHDLILELSGHHAGPRAPGCRPAMERHRDSLAGSDAEPWREYRHPRYQTLLRRAARH